MRRAACQSCHVHQGHIELLQPQKARATLTWGKKAPQKGGCDPTSPTFHPPQPEPGSDVRDSLFELESQPEWGKGREEVK